MTMINFDKFKLRPSLERSMTDDIQDRVRKRVDSIKQAHPSVSLDSLILESDYGKWGVILYTDYQFATYGLDFIESSESWKRPEAVEQYNGLIDEGYCVMVYAPPEALDDLTSKLKNKGGRANIRLGSNQEFSIRPHTLAEAIA